MVIFGLSALAAFAQSDCSCCTDAYMQFDFWIGEWQVVDSNGVELGQNTITYQQDSCLLRENWRSANSTGTSNSYFNASDSSWNQIWIDNKGGSIVLKGKSINGAIIMSSTPDIGGNFHRISWSPKANGTVVQQWDYVDAEGTLLRILFYGIYRPKS